MVPSDVPRVAPPSALTILAGVDRAAEPDASWASRELTREFVSTTTAPLAAVLARAEAGAEVVVAWFAGPIAGATCERLAGWAAAFRPRPGLIARAPGAVPGDAELALAAGFDDAVVGECGLRELAARVRAVQRRVGWSRRGNGGRIRHGELLVDLGNHVAWVGDREITLTSTERAVIRALVRAAGRTLSRDDLLAEVWGDDDAEVSGRAVDNVVLRLRRKLGRPDLIETVRGVGFRLSAGE